MFTTVYAMWNCYISALLILYAPSHKGMGNTPSRVGGVDGMSEELEFNRLNGHDVLNELEEEQDTNLDTASRQVDKSDMQLLQDFAQKQNVD